MDHPENGVREANLGVVDQLPRVANHDARDHPWDKENSQQRSSGGGLHRGQYQRQQRAKTKGAGHRANGENGRRFDDLTEGWLARASHCSKVPEPHQRWGGDVRQSGTRQGIQKGTSVWQQHQDDQRQQRRREQ